MHHAFYALAVSEVTIRELRNHRGQVIDRVALGEQVTVTRDGRPVARLVPLLRAPLPLEEVRRRWGTLPPMELASLRHDLDAVIEPSL